MFARVLHRIEEGIIGLLLTAMTLITFSQVVARYVFNAGAVWALELTTYLFAWLVLFGASYGVRVGAHIGIDAAVKHLPPKLYQAGGVLATVLCIAYCVIMFVGAWEYVSQIYMLGIECEDLPIPQWVPYIILPAGLALLGFRFAQVGWGLLRGNHVRMLADEAAEASRERAAQEEATRSGYDRYRSRVQ
jgi:C4-dicarboxylate transporter DctQ subunit